jgi:signal transduction histidine kinase
VKRVGWPKWHYLYFVLAAFDVFTVCAGLYLTHSIMSIYSRSVEVNQTWAERVLAYSHLGELAAAVNAPGNDVFDSDDVETENARMRAAMQAFDLNLAKLRAEAQMNLAPTDAQPLIAHLERVSAAMDSMTGEAQLIFSFVRAREPHRAGKRMATMDKKYGVVNSALADLRYSVARVQQKNFEQQTAAAAMQQKYEYLIGALLLLMVGGATLYGHRMAKQVESDMADKERHLAEIREAQARLKERSFQLEESNGWLHAEIQQRLLALHALQETNLRLHALFKRTLEAQEDERQHIARELHEEVAQMLSSLRMRLDSLRLTPAMKKYIEPQVKDAGTIAESALHRLQDLVRDLTPHGMEYIGLAGVLEAHLKEWTQGSGLAVQFSAHLSAARPPFKIETAAYRVAEEAVSNVVRHARAETLRVELLQRNGELHVYVTDDGLGFDVEAARRDSAIGNRLGITLMEQRMALLGGRLEIISAPGRGTAVKAVFPASAQA